MQLSGKASQRSEQALFRSRCVTAACPSSGLLGPPDGGVTPAVSRCERGGVTSAVSTAGFGVLELAEQVTWLGDEDEL